MTPAEAQAYIQLMRANGAKYTNASPEERIGLHDANMAIAQTLNNNGYQTSYNSITGDYTIVGQSLYQTQPTGGSTQAGNGTGYNLQPPITHTLPPSGQESLLQADTPNIGGLVAIGTVLGLLFLLK